jgi:LysM repeat protein
VSSLSTLLVLRLLADPCADLEPAATDPYALKAPRLVEHEVTPGERIADIAVRYGVDPREVTDRNGLDAWTRRVRPGKTLRVLAHRVPPPRERLKVRVAAGDTWSSIAIEHRVPVRMLRAYNWHDKRLREGDEITVWIDPGAPRTVHPTTAPRSPAKIAQRAGGASVGRPQRGKIVAAVQLPESRCYTRGKPERMWGSSHAIAELQRSLVRLRHVAGYRGDVVIGAISLERGGKFPPHRSHQSGRDADIRLPLLPGIAPRRAPHPDEVDWPATWALVDALLEGERVAVVFLDRKLQRRLYEAARWQGVSHERLGELLQALDPERLGTVVRHADGHDGHLHVRFRCAASELDCRG